MLAGDNMTKIHVRVKTIEDKIAEYVENNGIEIYVDYNDSLSEAQVDSILEGKAYEVRDEIEMEYDRYSDGVDLQYYWEECREATGASQEDIDGWLEKDGFYPSDGLSDYDWKKLLNYTHVNIVGIVWDAEFNFNNWAYAGPVNYSDVKESLKILGVNPLDFKRHLTGGSMTSGPGKLRGYFPDMPNRVPKVEVKDLYDNMCSLYDGVMHFCFGDLEEIAEVLASDSKNVTIKKGTNVVFYDRGNGAGITEVELIGDITIPRKMLEFRNDTSNSYGVQACYGFTNNYWTEGHIHNAK